MDPLIFQAVVNGDIAALDSVLPREGDLEATCHLLQAATCQGDQVIHLAARFGQVNLVRVLYVDRGNPVDLKAQNKRGDTALHCAAVSMNSLAMLNLLLELATVERLGPEPWRLAEFVRAKNHNGETCLHEALRYGRTEVVNLLVATDDNIVDEMRTPLVQTIDNDGVSALYLATTLHRADMVRILTLTERVHKASYSGPKGKTALHAALFAFFPDLLRILVHWKSADDKDLRTSQDESGRTPLHYVACFKECPVTLELISILLTGGGETDASPAYSLDSAGSLPIHVAAAHGSLQTVKLLLQKFPDCLLSSNSSGKTLLHIAIKHQKDDIVKYICQENTTFMTILNARDRDGNTPLHLAVLYGYGSGFCNLMRVKEVCLLITNKEGHTALDIAIFSTKTKVGGMQSRHEWMSYSLRLACGNHGVVDLNPWLQAGEEEEKIWEKISKSAGVLAVSAALILNATLVLPFNVATHYQDQSPDVHNHALRFRVFMTSNTLAFVLSAIAIISCTYAGFATTKDRFRRHQLYFGAMCVGGAALAIVTAFIFGQNLAFKTDLSILPLVTAVFLCVACCSGIATQIHSCFQHNKALKDRLGCRLFFSYASSVLEDTSVNHSLWRMITMIVVVYSIAVAVSVSRSVRVPKQMPS